MSRGERGRDEERAPAGPSAEETSAKVAVVWHTNQGYRPSEPLVGRGTLACNSWPLVASAERPSAVTGRPPLGMGRAVVEVGRAPRRCDKARPAAQRPNRGLEGRERGLFRRAGVRLRGRRSVPNRPVANDPQAVWKDRMGARFGPEHQGQPRPARLPGASDPSSGALRSWRARPARSGWRRAGPAGHSKCSPANLEVGDLRPSLSQQRSGAPVFHQT